MALKLRVLFLDDRSSRFHAAIKYYADAELTLVSNVREALRMLSSREWDIVSLDHDLNGCDFEDPDSPTSGMEIVRYLQKTVWPPDMPSPLFKIHSKNLFAAHLMLVALKDMGFSAQLDQSLTATTTESMKYDRDGNPI